MLFMMNLEEKQHGFEALRALGPMRSKPAVAPKPEELESFVEFLDEGAKACDEAGLRETGDKITLTRTYIANNRSMVDFSSLAADCRNISDVLMRDSWTRKFVQIPEKYGDYAEQEQLFGSEVYKAFPSAREDIKQAGNCLAVEDYTGCVFHLMRAVEWGLRALCGDLRIIRILKTKKGKPKYIGIEWAEWDRILEPVHERVDAKIRALAVGKRKQDAQEFYYPLLRDLRGFKEAFRNHVMHARRDYKPKEAEAVLDNVKRFMELLSSISCARRFEIGGDRSPLRVLHCGQVALLPVPSMFISITRTGRRSISAHLEHTSSSSSSTYVRPANL